MVIIRVLTFFLNLTLKKLYACQTQFYIILTNRKLQYTSFIIQYLKPKHENTQIFHVFLHENSVKVINSLYTFFDGITFYNYHYKQKVVKLISRE